MQSLDRQVQVWESEARAIAAVLSAREHWPNVALRERSASEVVQYGSLAAYFASLVGQCLLALAALEQLGSAQRVSNRILTLRGYLAASGRQENRMLLAKDFLLGREDVLQYGDSSDAESVFESFCELKHLLAANEVLQDPDIAGTLLQLGREVLRQKSLLEETDRTRLERSCRALLTKNGLFPRLRDSAGNLLAESQKHLFQIANLFEERRMMIAGLDSVLEKSDADADLKGLIRHILESLARATHDGIDIFEVATRRDKGFPWPLRDLTDSGQVMIIPGEGNGSCSKILLAFASSRAKSGQLAPKKVMTQVQQSIIRCRGTLRAVIFVADLAAQGGEVQDHLPIIEDFLLARDIRVFIPVTTMARRLNALDWRG
jgi:hypothetical protein